MDLSRIPKTVEVDLTDGRYLKTVFDTQHVKKMLTVLEKLFRSQSEINSDDDFSAGCAEILNGAIDDCETILHFLETMVPEEKEVEA